MDGNIYHNIHNVLYTFYKQRRTIFNTKNELKSNNNFRSQMTIDATIWNIDVDKTVGEFCVTL